MTTHVPQFGTDIGPTCAHCGSTLWTYDVKTATFYCGDGELDDRSEVDARCTGCLRRMSFETRSRLDTISAIRWNHEEHIKATHGNAWAVR